MKIIHIILVFVFASTLTMVARAQEKPANEIKPDEINKAVLKLINYYESYEDSSSESQRRAKFDIAFEEITKGTATSKDYNDAYKIIDAYIKSDKNPSVNNESKQGSLDDFIKNTDQYKQAEKAINQGYNTLINMSYPDFEKTVLQMQPDKSRREIKEAFNRMHSGDGKKVAITAADDEMTKEQQMLWAIETMNNPKDYNELLKAAKILDPKISEEKIKQAWEKKKGKQ